MEQLITIELFGQPYTFKADDDVGKAKGVADALVREVAMVEAQQNGRLSQTEKLTVMILAALNIANENHEIKTKYSDLLENISERSSMLIQSLDTGLTEVSTFGR